MFRRIRWVVGTVAVALALLAMGLTLWLRSGAPASVATSRSSEMRCSHPNEVSVISLLFGPKGGAASIGDPAERLSVTSTQGPGFAGTAAQMSGISKLEPPVAIDPDLIEGFQVIDRQADPVSAARIAAGYGWACRSVPTP